MRFAWYQQNGHEGLAAADDAGGLCFLAGRRGYSGDSIDILCNLITDAPR